MYSILVKAKKPTGAIIGTVLAMLLLTFAIVFSCYGCAITHRKLHYEHKIETMHRFLKRRSAALQMVGEQESELLYPRQQEHRSSAPSQRVTVA